MPTPHQSPDPLPDNAVRHAPPQFAGCGTRQSVRVRAPAVGMLALAALAIGAFAVGALAIGRLAIGRARIRRLEIDELVVRKLRFTDALQTPSSPDRLE